MDLSTFLLVRIAEDEELARGAICPCGGPACTPELGWMHMNEVVARLDSKRVAEHVVEWSPARVIAECEAKRRIVEGLDYASHYGVDGEDRPELNVPYYLRLLALPYADHPDYDPEWRP